MLLASHPVQPMYSHQTPPLHTPQQQLQFEAFEALGSPANAPASETPYDEKRLAAQLAHLASQHHASEYNRLKFGARGAPISYVPLSLQLPGHVKDLQTRQVTNAKKQAWWPCDRKGKGAEKQSVLPPSMHLYLEGPQQGVPGLPNPPLMAPQSVDLPGELSAAIASPLSTALPIYNSIHQTKTSKTHPIKCQGYTAEFIPIVAIGRAEENKRVHDNALHSPVGKDNSVDTALAFSVSLIVPLDLLPNISSQLVVASNSSPVMFQIPADHFLDRIILAANSGGLPQSQLYFPSSSHRKAAGSPNMFHPLHGQITHPPILWSESQGSDALRAAMHGNSFTPRSVVPTSAVLIEDTAPSPVAYVSERHFPQSTSPRVPEVALPIVSPSDASTQIQPTGLERWPLRLKRATSAPPVLSLFKVTHSKPSKLDTKPVLRHSFPVVSRTAASPAPPMRNGSPVPPIAPSPLLPSAVSSAMAFVSTGDLTAIGRKKSPPLPSSISPVLRLPTAPCMEAQPRLSVIGNLFLSSCPGKKVRLTGPIKGRGAICRDLAADLGRMKELGVGCVVCCLDDEELHFLGASWPDYLRAAHQLDLDVLRLPTPEGLTPLTPEALDKHLSQVIASYTMLGIPILVHCRGGVGRAGLVACCWLLKLGLCGWKNPHLCRPRTSAGDVCPATLQLVERVIFVVRRRRSLKAVETYEQVKFLVDYVEYLDNHKGQAIRRDVD